MMFTQLSSLKIPKATNVDVKPASTRRFEFLGAAKSIFSVSPLICWGALIFCACAGVGLSLFARQKFLELRQHKNALEAGVAEVNSLRLQSLDEPVIASLSQPEAVDIPSTSNSSENQTLLSPVPEEALLAGPFQNVRHTEVRSASVVANNTLTDEPVNPQVEIERLKSQLQLQSEQIALLSEENYDLRLRLDFPLIDESNDTLDDIVRGKSTGVYKAQPKSAVVNSKAQASAVEASVAAQVSYQEQPQSTQELMSTVLIQGFEAYQQGDYINAQHWYKQALQIDASHRDARLGMAAVEMRLGQTSEALSRYQWLLSEDNGDETAFDGVLTLAGSHNDLAQELWVHALTAPRNQALMFHRLGVHFSELQRWDKASEAFRRAAIDLPAASVWFNLAVSNEHIGELQQAITYYERALQLAGGRDKDSSGIDSGGFEPGLARQRVEALRMQLSR